MTTPTAVSETHTPARRLGRHRTSRSRGADVVDAERIRWTMNYRTLTGREETTDYDVCVISDEQLERELASVEGIPVADRPDGILAWRPVTCGRELKSLCVYIVRISATVAYFRERLRAVDGAALVRELPPGRVVVTLPSTAVGHRLAALDGVESVTRDRPSGHCESPRFQDVGCADLTRSAGTSARRIRNDAALD